MQAKAKIVMAGIPEQIRCQSCGMPLVEEAGNLGTEADGSSTWEYCIFCYRQGKFAQPDQTVEGMIESSIGFMTLDLNFSREDAERISREVIPKLRRWTKT